MALFDPFVGNHNPSDHQLNEYIRILKEALVDTSAFLVESGSYTGDATSPRTISLTDETITPAFVALGRSNGTVHMTFATSVMSPTTITFRNGAAPFSSTTVISSLDEGSFEVNDNTWSNNSGGTFEYVVIGT